MPISIGIKIKRQEGRRQQIIYNYPTLPSLRTYRTVLVPIHLSYEGSEVQNHWLMAAITREDVTPLRLLLQNTMPGMEQIETAIMEGLRIRIRRDPFGKTALLSREMLKDFEQEDGSHCGVYSLMLASNLVSTEKRVVGEFCQQAM